jgi:copper chaperone NosL
MTGRWPLVPAVLLAACLHPWGQGCAAGPPRPAALDTRTESCRSCRMAVSEPRFAAQIVAPGEDPLFFDDVGCLRDYLKSGARVAAGSLAYVADHRTREWVEAGRAVYTRVAGLGTPMGSGLIAHAGATSRDADQTARGGTPLGPTEVFGRMLPGGTGGVP